MSSENQADNIPKVDKSDAEDSGKPITFDDPEKLIEAVRKQVEYYFSKENLQSDAYLTSQMDANMSVPISVVMKFAKMKALTQDEEVLRKALENSTVSLIDNRIKANIKATGRSTIILREIPADTPEEEVRAIFAFDGCKPIVSMRSDIGDTWFIVMDSEEDAKDTLLDLRLKKRAFRGQSVKGRLKTETVVRSFYPMQTAPVVPPMTFPGMPYPGAGGFVGGPVPVPVDPRMYFGTQPGGAPAEGQAASGDEAGDGAQNGQAVAAGSDSGRAGFAAAAAAAGRGDKRAAGAGGYTQTGQQLPYPPAQAAGAPKGAQAGAAGKDGQSRGIKAAGAGAAAARGASGRDAHTAAGRVKGGAGKNGPGGRGYDRATIEINSANFPPLQANAATTSDEVPTPGYKGEFIKYSFDDIINIVKEVKDVSLPETIKPDLHPLAMSEKPNLDLLKRQRTFSIDETREQLMQGRPVQREAVLAAGAGDYGSMMYGDGYAAMHGLEVKAAAPPQQGQTQHSSPNAHHGHKSGHGHGHHGKGHNDEAPKKAAGGSWAAMVASNTPNTDAPAAAAANAAAASSGAAKAKAPAVSKDAAAPGSPDRAKKATPAKSKAAAAPASAAAATAAAPTTTAAAANGAAPTAAAAGGDKDKEEKKKDDKKDDNNKDKDRRRNGERRAGDGKKESKGKGKEKGGDDAEHGEEGAAAGASGTEGGSHRGPPSSWGGKPTFANVLKQKREAEAAAAAAAAAAAGKTDGEASSGAAPAASSETATTEKAAKAEKSDKAADKHDRHDKHEKHHDRNHKGGNNGGDKKEPDAAKKAAMQGVWAKEPLPPL